MKDATTSLENRDVFHQLSQSYEYIDINMIPEQTDVFVEILS